MDLKCASFNCHSIRRNCEIVKNLMTDHHIILLQETMLYESDTGFLSRLCDDFEYAAAPSVTNFNLDIQGRPQGGLAIYWHKSFFACAHP